MLKIKIIKKSEIIDVTQVNIGVQDIYICNLKLKVPNEIPVDFHYGSNYDYHFIIEELANEFKGQFERLGENKEK